MCPPSPGPCDDTVSALPSQSGVPVAWTARAADSRAVRALVEALDIEPLVATLLCQRGLRDVDAARRFLEPSVDDLRDPFLLADMGRAADRVATAVAAGESVLVYGDADVDGLSGTALLVHFFRFLGVEPLVHVPNRNFEGYSFSDAGVEAVLATSAKVVISVDNGTSSVEAIGRLQDAGVDVIVTDHHLPGEVLPPAYALVNPRREDCSYPFGGLAGVGVAFKLACAVASRQSEGRKRSPDMMRFLGEAMAWTALGTVSDMVELSDENRVLVMRGLRAIPRSTHPGLMALCHVAGVEAEGFSAEDIAFRIAPRLNAATRMGRTDLSLALLTADDPERARQLAWSLDKLNKQRQVEDRAMFAAIREQLGDGPVEDPVIVLRDDTWNPGLLGLVASRLAQLTGRPAVLVSGLKGDPAKGSMRSVEGVHAQKALVACAEHLTGYGGHAFAAGFSLNGADFDAFRRTMLDHIRSVTSEDHGPVPLTFDAELPLVSLNRRLLEQINALAPFGQGNPAPVFGARGVTVVAKKTMGEDKSHLSLELGQGPASIRAVSFGNGQLAKTLNVGQVVDVLFKPKLNHFRGRTTVQLELVDLSTARQPADVPASAEAPATAAPANDGPAATETGSQETTA